MKKWKVSGVMLNASMHKWIEMLRFLRQFHRATEDYLNRRQHHKGLHWPHWQGLTFQLKVKMGKFCQKMLDTGWSDVGVNKLTPQPSPRNELSSRFYIKESVILPDLKNIPQAIALLVGILPLNIGYVKKLHLQLFIRPWSVENKFFIQYRILIKLK